MTSTNIINKPIVAIIIAIYKGDVAEYFKDALYSVINQNYPRDRLRIILGVDGPLTQELENIINDNIKEFYSVIVSDVNIGLGAILNKLINNSIGCKYTARMDADDLCHPDRIDRQVAYMELNADVDILGAAIIEFNDEIYCAPRIYPGKNNIRRTISKSSPLAHPSVMFRSDSLMLLNGYPDVKFNEDIAMWFKALKMGMIIDNMSEVLVYFRVSDKMLARRGSKKAWSEFLIYISGINDLRLNRINLIFPILRLIYRLSPNALKKYFFGEVKIRNYIQS